MALRSDRKGMLSSIDAMIFLSIMVLVTAGLFAYSSFERDDVPMAQSVAESFFAAELRVSDLYPTEDSQTVPVSDLLAACINSGNVSKAEEYTGRIMRDLVPRHHSFQVEMTFNGKILSVGGAGGDIVSQYETEYMTDGGPLGVTVRIF